MNKNKSKTIKPPKMKFFGGFIPEGLYHSISLYSYVSGESKSGYLRKLLEGERKAKARQYDEKVLLNFILTDIANDWELKKQFKIPLNEWSKEFLVFKAHIQKKLEKQGLSKKQIQAILKKLKE